MSRRPSFYEFAEKTEFQMHIYRQVNLVQEARQLAVLFADDAQYISAVDGLVDILRPLFVQKPNYLAKLEALNRIEHEVEAKAQLESRWKHADHLFYARLRYILCLDLIQDCGMGLTEEAKEFWEQEPETFEGMKEEPQEETEEESTEEAKDE